jgi:hypothetical protein
MADDRRKDGGTASTRCSRRRGRLTPDDDLVARVLADARTPCRRLPLRTCHRAARGGLFRHPPSWIAALGGWGGFGGVTAAGPRRAGRGLLVARYWWTS